MEGSCQHSTHRGYEVTNIKFEMLSKEGAKHTLIKIETMNNTDSRGARIGPMSLPPR